MYELVRRRLLSAWTGLTIFIAAVLAIASDPVGEAKPSVAPAPAVAKAPLPPIGPVKQIHAGVLNVGYVELGDPSGRAVILLHGWPYDIHSFDAVAPCLAQSGYRVIVPHLRGFGTTRFLSNDTPRNGQQSAL